jgi:hypothetical protein
MMYPRHVTHGVILSQLMAPVLMVLPLLSLLNQAAPAEISK